VFVRETQKEINGYVTISPRLSHSSGALNFTAMKKIINHINVLDLSDYLTVSYKQMAEDYFGVRNNNKRPQTAIDKTSYFIFDYKPQGNSEKIQGDYFKSKHTLPEYDGGIFIENNEIKYIHTIHESLTDSMGREHLVQVGYEDAKFRFSDECFEVRGDTIYSITNKIPINIEYITFQFNLRRYLLICAKEYSSTYQFIGGLLRGLYNPAPAYIREFNYRITDAMKTAGYAPFEERCFMSGNNQSCHINYIPDSIFFNYKDKATAMQRVFSRASIANEFLVQWDYLNIHDDINMVSLMNKRFSNRIKFESFMKYNEYLLTH